MSSPSFPATPLTPITQHPMYAVSAPLFVHMLSALKGVLAKGEAHALEHKVDPAVLLQARLHLSMFPLSRQIQIATDFAKGVVARLAGLEVPSWPDTETDFAALQARIDRTIAFIGTVGAAQLDGSEQREIVLNPGTPRERRFDGQTYVIHYGVPQFLFHVTTAYAILRHHGVPVGKANFMGTA